MQHWTCSVFLPLIDKLLHIYFSYLALVLYSILNDLCFISFNNLLYSNHNLPFRCTVVAFCPNNHEVHIYKFFGEKWERIHVLQKVFVVVNFPIYLTILLGLLQPFFCFEHINFFIGNVYGCGFWLRVVFLGCYKTFIRVPSYMRWWILAHFSYCNLIYIFWMVWTYLMVIKRFYNRGSS